MNPTLTPDSVNATNRRVAWLMPSLARGYCWQPVFTEFTKLFPNTVIFTCIFSGFVPGFEGKFDLRRVSGGRFIAYKQEDQTYARGLFFAPLSILKELWRTRPDVIFTNAFSLWTLCALLFKLFTKCRVVILWEGSSTSVMYLNSKMRLAARRFMARAADAGISNMRGGVEYLHDVLGMPAAKLVRHPYEVPNPSVLSATVKHPDLGSYKHPTFLFVGSLISRKGWDCLLDSANLLVQRGLDEFSIVFIGDGDRKAEMLATISDRGLGGVCHVVGAIPYDQLGPYYAAADVFVFPTFEDTWGLVLLEAMCFGKAILCSKYAGSREMVEHGVNGFIFDPHDPEELAGYMTRFIVDGEIGAQFGHSSRAAIAPYTPARAASVLARLAAGEV